ncbi:DB domain-containing protein [Aphelenchoides besseyi]|nr:DB domain-containing protein [Aphelenchoides besseyi]KAI6237849.1 DB domain-containing protein [Aphelenchoides besseyi]
MIFGSRLLVSVCFVLFGISYALDITVEQLRQQCPADKTLCYEKALQGGCFGSSLKAQVLQKTCPCVCPAVLHNRIQGCCKKVGNPEHKFCFPLCGYNTTIDDLGSSLGIKCVGSLTTWSYCASDSNDNTACCKAKGITDECLSFCGGQVPTCDLQRILSYQPCLKSLKTIMQCHVENLTPTPRFDPDWQTQCEWE